MENKTQAQLEIEALMSAMKSYEENKDLQEKEAEEISKSLNVDKEKILKVLKAAIEK